MGDREYGPHAQARPGDRWSGRRAGGNPAGGGYRTGSGDYRTGSGDYRTGSGDYRAAGGQYGGDSGRYTAGGQYGAGSGRYRAGSGEYGEGSGRYPAGSGEYGEGSGRYPSGGGSRTGGYRSGSGEYRSGGHRASGPGYRTGSHRVVRERGSGRRLGITLAGVGAGIVVCVLAVFAIMQGSGVGGDEGSGQVVGSGASENAPTATGERTGVPDACTVVRDDLANRLVPSGERNPGDNYQSSDRQTQCVWGVYAGSSKRQLTVEIRAIAGGSDSTPTEAARTMYASEQKADESGKVLLPGQRLAQKTRLTGVGDEGYAVYSVDDRQDSGEAIANIRDGNVLVTIHYSGGDKKQPLSAKSAVDGAVETGKAVLENLGTS
ncbi:hypothetical protein [Spirillospora albida]|uniref:hypothetical protein n=1 Tax=Spirillospora albida TaxID=58123 RepID=UPI0004C212EA|nr:hypothetical protein [Spirillospora albida]